MHFPKARFLRILAAVLVVLALGPSPSAPVDAAPASPAKLDPLLQQRSLLPGRSRVVLRAAHAGAASPALSLVPLLGGRVIRRLPIIDGVAIDLPNAALSALAGSPLVGHLSLDRLVSGAMERTGATIGAAAVRQELGLDGAGVGIAVIDSGVAPSHDDLADPASGTQRVDRFVDLTANRSAPYDDYGHGTHVAGIIAGNGFDSGGARSGIAPGAHLIVTDCDRRNVFARIGARNPLCPTIEWEKHQSPFLWSKLLGDVGFEAPRVRWAALNTLRGPGQLLLGHRLGSYMLTSAFLLRMRRSAHPA